MKDEIVYRTFACAVSTRAVDPETRTIRGVVFSDESVDSHGTRLTLDWNLARYAKNPVHLWNHRRDSGLMDNQHSELPIGSVENLSVTGKELVGDIRFVTAEANPFAELVWQSWVQGSVRAVSVGFRPGKITEEKVDGGTIWILSENELLETSSVPVGSNPNAVGGRSDTPRAQILEQYRHLLTQAQPGQHACVRQAKDNMDIEELKRQLEQARLDCATARAERDQARAALETEKAEHSKREAVVSDLRSELTKTATERNEATARADAAEAKIAVADQARAEAEMAAEVDALVGRKITPAERDHYLKLRRANADLFREAMELKPDLALGRSVIPQPEPRAEASVGQDEEAHARVIKRLSKAAEGTE